MLYIALILGIIEGLTEFIPVSSTGHLILFGDILGFKGPDSQVFEIVIQLGAILAVCWLYRTKLISAAVGTLKRNPEDLRFSFGLFIAFIPAMVLGALTHDYIKAALFNTFDVSIALIVGGIAILLVEKFKPITIHNKIEEFPLSTFFKIGLFQCLALIPGTSRSGATIIGALLLGVERKAAAEFSFFLAIPTMFAATAYDIYKNMNSLNLDGIEIIAVGFVTAFISALFVIKFFIGFVSKHGFAPFAIYRIILGSLMLFLLN
jgi:undecaprenyl-diphosphatase